MFDVILRNKRTGEVISTEEHGAFAYVFIDAGGMYELQEVGTVQDASSMNGPDAIEKYFEPDDYELVKCQFNLPKQRREFLLSKNEILRELKPILTDAFYTYHFDEINIDAVNGFLVTMLTDDEEKELHAALSDIHFIKDIYPRGHFKSDQQNWKVRFVPEVDEHNFKTLSSMQVDEIHEGIEEFANMSKVSKSSPYGKFLHNNNVEGLGKYLICTDVIFDDEKFNQILELELMDSKGESILIDYEHLSNCDVTIINHAYVPSKIQKSLISRFKERVIEELSFLPHMSKVKLQNKEIAFVIGAINHENSSWGKFFVAIGNEGKSFFYDYGDVCNGIVVYEKLGNKNINFDIVDTGNEMATYLFKRSDCPHVHNYIKVNSQTGGK